MSKWRAAIARNVATRAEFMANLSGAEPDKFNEIPANKTSTSASGRIVPVYPVSPGVDQVCNEGTLSSSHSPCQEQGNSPKTTSKLDISAYARGNTGETEFIRSAPQSDPAAAVAAWRQLYKTMCAMPRLTGWPEKRWRQMQIDFGVFVDEWGLRAAKLGWDETSLFGMHPDQPFARIDAMGLVPLLNGMRVVELTQTTATLVSRTGARQSYRRKPAEVRLTEIAESGAI